MTPGRRGPLALLVLVAVVLIPLPGDSASADCATSALQFEDGRELPHVVRGETLTLSGDGYVKGCDDGGDPDIGCGAPLHEQPRDDIELRLQAQNDESVLGISDADNDHDELGHVSWSVTIPADTPVGPATLVPDGGQPLEVRIVDE